MLLGRVLLDGKRLTHKEGGTKKIRGYQNLVLKGLSSKAQFTFTALRSRSKNQQDSLASSVPHAKRVRTCLSQFSKFLKMPHILRLKTPV